MFRNRDTDVLVVGAGPVGLLAATLLAERGIRVEIIDEQWRPAAHSYALALHPHSLSLLARLGIADELVAKGHRIDGVAFYDGRNEVARVDLGQLPVEHPFVVVVPQNELEALLAKRLARAGGQVRWNHRLARLRSADDRVEATVDRLAKESAGYGFAGTVWTVDRSIELQPVAVIGADGHRSLVRRQSDIDLEPAGESQLFGVFEFVAEHPATRDLVVALDESTTNVLWPMGGDRFRWSFQLFEWEMFAEARTKDRLQVKVGREALPYVSHDMLGELITERVPWFDSEVEDVLWSAAVRFDRRLAERFGKGRVWLAGDSAHLAAPAGVQSMNVGLGEAAELAELIAAVVADGASLDTLADYDRARQAEWRQLLMLDGPPRALATAADWPRANAERITACIPASGDDLSALLGQLGLAWSPVGVGQGE